ncbi:MAG: NifB/NifX family molybdenum-iron cluster-binding protein [Candidatus Bathyarchaeia archaeon]
MRLIIPIEEYKGLKSAVSQHFGKAPFFALIDLRDDGEIEALKAVENRGEHMGGLISVEELITGLKPDALIVKGMGPRALYAFQSQGMAVFTGEFETVEDALKAYLNGKLKGLTEACKEARHRFLK